MNIAYPQLLSLCLPLVHLLKGMFFRFSYRAQNIHIPEEHCYTDFLSSQILFRNKKRWYKMILEDHLHHVWPRTGINFNFLPLFSLLEPSVTHLVSEDIELRTQVSWAWASLAPSLHLRWSKHWAEQQTVRQSFTSLLAVYRDYSDSNLINFQNISPNFHITLKLLVPKDISNCFTNANFLISIII